jgi:molybdenum cofactor cytidylyltransferase
MITAILLAAGQSKRVPIKNKLLIKYKKKFLINHILDQLIKSKIQKIIIVLGHEHFKVRKLALKSKKIQFVVNKKFKTGMASSIKEGLKKLGKKNKGFLNCSI